ncbi:MAG: DNA translocase FtsK, partial [Planctomycetota bacterium]|nr:DNA translocase FtsK [Planctomycetota bacterium]
MPESNHSSSAGREVMGLALCTVFAFPFVLAVLTLLRPAEADVTGTGALARQLVGAFGVWPTMLLSGGFAAVGAVLFFAGKEVEVDVGRHLCGILFTAIGLGICLGVISPTLGGEFGANTGGALKASIATWAGLALGLAVLFSAVWLTWLRDPSSFSGNSRQDPTISDALSERDADGVSQAEARALVPDPATVAYMDQALQEAGEVGSQIQPLPPSPYPEDVRIHGEVPEGAQSLKPDNDPSDSERAHEADSDKWSSSDAQDGPQLGPGEDLAAPEVGGSEGAESGGGLDADSSSQIEVREPVDPSLESPPDPSEEDSEALSEEVLPAPGPSVSWEQPDLFEEPEGEEEGEEGDLTESEASELEDEEESAELEEEEEEEEDGDEPDSLLTPAAPPVKDQLEPAELLHEAGSLFLREGRVAVSLLQRGFSLDFDMACAVLDELQDAGLIGPYKGGQKRDILLTSEEWDAQA